MPKKVAVPVAAMRILKTNTCPSLSGRSELKYHIGIGVGGEILLRVVANSNSGQFNSEWVTLTLIEHLLSEHPATTPMTAAVLRPVFRRKSSNSPAFLFAALFAESIVLPGAGKDSGYLLGDIEAFKHAVSALDTRDNPLDVATDVPVASAKGKRRHKEPA